MFRNRLLLVLGAAVLAVALTAAGYLALGAATDLFAVVSMHGLIALGLGIGGTLLLTGLLLVLVFHSNRAGYDERASRSEE